MSWFTRIEGVVRDAVGYVKTQIAYANEIAYASAANAEGEERIQRGELAEHKPGAHFRINIIPNIIRGAQHGAWKPGYPKSTNIITADLNDLKALLGLCLAGCERGESDGLGATECAKQCIDGAASLYLRLHPNLR